MLYGKRLGGNLGPKILVFDIECTNLKASFGTVLAIAHKWLGERKVNVPTILDYTTSGMLDDKPLIEEFREVYCKADYTVAHYGKRFDLPYIQTKCLKHKLGPMPNIPMMDTCEIAWKNFKIHSNRLGTWLEYLDCKYEKKAMRADDWLHAAHGCKKAMKAVKERAKYDVLGLEEVFLAMRPWIKNEPNRHLFGASGCVSCGSYNLQSRGYQANKTRRYQRYQCTDCGKWQRSVHCDERRAELV